MGDIQVDEMKFFDRKDIKDSWIALEYDDLKGILNHNGILPINRLLDDADDGCSVENRLSKYEDQVSCEANLTSLSTPRYTPDIFQDLGIANPEKSEQITENNEGII